MGITTEHNSISLSGNTIWIEDKGIAISKEDISATPRVGIDYAREDALLPYRFVLNYKKYIST